MHLCMPQPQAQIESCARKCSTSVGIYYTYIRVCVCIYIYIYIYIICTHARMHTRTYACRRTHIRNHTHETTDTQHTCSERCILYQDPSLHTYKCLHIHTTVSTYLTLSSSAPFHRDPETKSPHLNVYVVCMQIYQNVPMSFYVFVQPYTYIYEHVRMCS